MLKHVGEDGSAKTDGRQNLLKQSGFYPRALGISIAQAWQHRRAWQPSAKFKAPGPWQRLKIHGVTHGVMLHGVMLGHQTGKGQQSNSGR